MGIRSWVGLRAPKFSQLDKLARQKIKGHHPKKAMQTWFHRSVQKLKKLGVWFVSLRSSLGSKIPGVQIRTRNVVTRNIDNFMTGKGVEAQSSSGIYVDSKEKAFVQQEFSTGAVFGDDGVLKSLDKNRLKEIENDFDNYTRRLTDEWVAFDRKEEAGQATKEDSDRLENLKMEFGLSRERYTRANALAYQLDISSMGEKMRSKASMRQLLKAQANLMALNHHDLNNAFYAAKDNIASFRLAQRDIDSRIVELGETYRKMVYDDVVEFLDAKDGDFAKLVGEQKLRYLIRGTDKLGAMTKGVRMPGLDWYVQKAKSEYQNDANTSNVDILHQGAVMMLNDWSLFHDQVEARMKSIRRDGTDGSSGSFNPDDMATYHHVKSYFATLTSLEELAGTGGTGVVNKDALYNINAEYGDELGFGLRVNKAANDAAVLEKYGMDSFDKNYFGEKLPDGISSPEPATTAQPSSGPQRESSLEDGVDGSPAYNDQSGEDDNLITWEDDQPVESADSTKPRNPLSDL